MQIEGWDIQCPEACSLRPGTKWGDRASQLLASGMSLRLVLAEAAKDKYPASMGSLSRHRRHLKQLTPAVDPSAPRASNIEILETIIQRGYANAKNWKPTIGDTMKAMDMWFRLTQGNPFDELLNTLAAAATGDESEMPDENPAAVSTSDEQEDTIDE